MIRSIFGKLLLSHIAVILVSTLTLAFLMSYLLRSHVVEIRRHELLAKGTAVIDLLQPDLQAGIQPSEDTIKDLGDLIGATIWFTDRSGTVLVGSPPERWNRRFPENSAEINALFAGTPHSWVHTRRSNDPSVVVALPVPGARNPTALFLYTPIIGITRATQALENLLAYSLVAGILAAIAFGLFISRHLTRPIANISASARLFAAGNFSSRTVATSNDEIGELGRTFNTMADSLANIEANRREFLANVSHELKTPVASIQAMSEAVLDGVVTKPDKQRQYLTNIVAETHRIGRLLRDLLDLSQLEAGELSIIRQSLPVIAYLRQEVDKHEPLLASKHLLVSFDVPANDLMVRADPDRLSQVLLNLISNAVRYAPESSTLVLKIRAAGHFAVISLADSGPGIPAVELPHIWERFYRVEKSRARTTGGTGLGLPITKKIVEAMGGAISATSIEGEGTIFTFTLPVSAD